jgi:hypothetical protein
LSVPANQLNFSELVPNDVLRHRLARYTQDFTYNTGRLFHVIDNICFDAHLQAAPFSIGNTPLWILRLCAFVLIAMISRIIRA